MKLITIFVILVIICLQVQWMYCNLINQYFRQNGRITYDYLLTFIHVVSKNNYYMNYGLWTENTTSLKKANRKLCNLVYQKADLNNTEPLAILDVGCGYGVQDIKWVNKLSPESSIIAVDISKRQIKHANKARIKNNIPTQRLNYMVGDAHGLLQKFITNEFDRILSLESAFHYADRPLFFRNVSELLKKDGIFVITDIVLNNSHKGIFKNLFINVSSDFLHIPKQNLISIKEWKTQLSQNNLELVSIEDITDKTFIPYYKYFFKRFIKKKGLPDFVNNILFTIFESSQPFSYLLACCKKAS